MSTKHNLCLMLVCLILDMLHLKWRCNEVKLTLSNGKQGVAHLRGILVCKSSKPLVKSLFNVPFGETLKRKKAFQSDNLFKGADDLWTIVATVRSHQTPSRGFAQHACKQSLQNEADLYRTAWKDLNEVKYLSFHAVLQKQIKPRSPGDCMFSHSPAYSQDNLTEIFASHRKGSDIVGLGGFSWNSAPPRLVDSQVFNAATFTQAIWSKTCVSCLVWRHR